MTTASDFVRRALRAVCTSGMFCAAQVAAQRPVPTIILDKGAKEFAEPFSQMLGMVELRDGRVLIVDNTEKEIRLVDFANGTVAVAVKSGAGPLEFQMGMMLGAAADSGVLYDVMQRRFLLFTPDGRPARTALFGGSDPMAFLSMMQPAHVDAAGRVYGQSQGMKIPMPAPGQSLTGNITFDDTVSIVRFDLRTGKSDSVARIRNVSQQIAPKMEMGPGGMKMSMSAPNFSAPDAWTVTQDGTVLLLRDGDYRIRFVSQGRERVGPAVPHPVIPITAAMQRTAMDSMRAQMRTMTERMQRGAGGASMPKMDIEVREPARWAATMSPYGSISVSRDGHIWVGTPDAAKPMENRSSRHDVLDGTGVLIARVTIAAGERIAGFGRGVVYTIRTDADDLQYLRRYALDLRP